MSKERKRLARELEKNLNLLDKTLADMDKYVRTEELSFVFQELCDLVNELSGDI